MKKIHFSNIIIFNYKFIGSVFFSFVMGINLTILAMLVKSVGLAIAFFNVIG